MTLADIDWPLILAGLGLFLFGIEFMGEGLKSLSGDKLKNIIDKYTSSPIKGIAIGAFVTCLIQSSSGTTALTIGLIRSGLMSLNQAIGIIMGANIGTVLTSFLVGLNVAQYSVYFIIIGSFMLMFSKNKKTIYTGKIIFGFGCLFFGLQLMGDNLGMIADVPEFSDIATFLAQNPWLGLVGGTILTMMVQSSAAVIAIVQQMYSAGAIGLPIALPFLFGSNIGTTITAILASFGGSTAAKRAATYHVLFNVVGSILFMLILYPFKSLMIWISSALHLAPALQLAVAHGIFNIITTLLFLPFINQSVALIKKVIPSKDKEYEMDLSELDPHVVNLFPAHALAIAKNKIIEMGHLTFEAVTNTKEYFITKNHSAKEYVYEMENAINILDSKITEYLVLISHETLNDHEAMEYLANMKTIKDFERIGDLSINIVRYFEAIFDEREDFSKEARDDLITMMDTVLDMLDKTLIAFENHDLEARDYVDEKEGNLDYFNKKAKQRHVQRVSKQIEKSALVNSTYVDILANLERMGDHCQNITEYYALEDDLNLPKETNSAFIG